MATSRLPLLRRISQLFFLLLFVGLLAFTSLRPAAGGDMHLRAPVRMFFVLDPLVAVTNALAGHALYRGLIVSLIILIPTLFLGRFFCGWICPMGTLQHWVGNLPSEAKRGKLRVESNRYKRWQTTKYVVLIAGLVAAFFGSMILGVLDPFSLLVRSMGLALLPAFNFAARAVLTPMEHSHIALLRSTSALVQTTLQATILDFRQTQFAQSLALGILFLLILAASLRVTRAWCRAVCPLGALLGAMSRLSIFGLEKSDTSCNRCNKCLLDCQGGDDPISGVPWRKSECLMCMNCLGSCTNHALAFRFFRPGLNSKSEVPSPDLTRRKTLTGLAAGAAAVPLMRANVGFGKGRHDRLLRPPGSLDEAAFLSRCIRCGECIKVCPNNSLHPTLEQAGLEGLWTPTLVPRIGYCEPSCVLCSEVCPTGAIWETTPKEKGWVAGAGASGGAGERIRIGTAFYDRGRCLPWAEATECIVCEEWCPVSPKAIYVEEADVIDASGNVKRLKQPRVDLSRCVGCGACEYACPLQDRPAVYVTSIGESRSPSSQILLSRN